jgi:hypothetical protein
MSTREQKLNELKRMVFYIAAGIEEWRISPNQQSEKLYLGQMLLMKNSLQNGTEIPNNLFDLYNKLVSPFHDWNISLMDELFDGQETFIEDGLYLSQTVTDFIREYESPDEEDLIPIKQLLVLCRSNEWDKQYRAVRTFLSQKENAVLSVVDFQYALHTLITEKELIEFVTACYEKIPRDIGNFRICPNCGWTLELIKGEWKCNSHKVCSKISDFSNIKPFSMEANLAIIRLKPSIQRYVLLPGLQEMRIFKVLSAYKPELYPNCDQYDLEIDNGSSAIHIDIKDVQNPKLLAGLFNEMGKGQQRKYLEKNVFIVVPNYHIKNNKAYMKIVYSTLENVELKKRFITERQLKNKLKMIGDKSNAI